jgi:hypothetical protein
MYKIISLFDGYPFEHEFLFEFSESFPIIKNLSLPRSNNPVRKLLFPGNSVDLVEAGIHRKNPHNFRSEYCFHDPAISGVFLQDPVTFLNDPVGSVGRDHRPG